MLFKLPTVLATTGTTLVKGLLSRSAFGTAMDPTGLVGLEARLPGLRPEAIAAARGFDVRVVSGILEGTTLGSAGLLDALEIGSATILESDLDRIVAQPGAHFGPMNDAFEGRMRDLVNPRR
jgi:hypothetical protein